VSKRFANLNLTATQTELLQHLADGGTTRTFRTARDHPYSGLGQLETARLKLGAKTAYHAVALALRRKLIL